MSEQLKYVRTSRYRKIRRVACIAVSVSICTLFLAACYILARVQSAAFQEGNPFPFITAIDRLNASNLEVVPVGTSGKVWLEKNRLEELSTDAMTRLLATRGWVLKDVMGSGRTYTRNSINLKVFQRMYTKNYIVFRAESRPY